MQQKKRASTVPWGNAGFGHCRFRSGHIVEPWLAYLRTDQSLGAAHSVAQWARWKTA